MQMCLLTVCLLLHSHATTKSGKRRLARVGRNAPMSKPVKIRLLPPTLKAKRHILYIHLHFIHNSPHHRYVCRMTSKEGDQVDLALVVLISRKKPSLFLSIPHTQSCYSLSPHFRICPSISKPVKSKSMATQHSG